MDANLLLDMEYYCSFRIYRGVKLKFRIGMAVWQESDVTQSMACRVVTGMERHRIGRTRCAGCAIALRILLLFLFCIEQLR